MTESREFGSVRRLKSGRWQARYRAPDGRRLAAATTFTTKRVASAWLADVRDDIERGRWKSPEQIAAEEAGAAAATVTVRDAMETWLATIPSANHAASSSDRVRLYISPHNWIRQFDLTFRLTRRVRVLPLAGEMVASPPPPVRAPARRFSPTARPLHSHPL
jgi:hypothetical protein